MYSLITTVVRSSVLKGMNRYIVNCAGSYDRYVFGGTLNGTRELNAKPNDEDRVDARALCFSFYSCTIKQYQPSAILEIVT